MRNWNRYWVFAVLVLVVMAAGSVLVERANASDTKPAVKVSPFATEVKLAKPATGGQKLCRVLWPGHWRDTISMPPLATVASCQAWEANTAATQYQLGCVFADGSTSLGPANGGAPSPDCGW